MKKTLLKATYVSLYVRRRRVEVELLSDTIEYALQGWDILQYKKSLGEAPTSYYPYKSYGLIT